ncbi:MAG: YigZ family protein [Bacteroidales bacterium]|nr:YigZ family protein [Bacteroidales bacterium]
MNDTFFTISGSSEGIFKDKGSKFYSFAFPVSNEEEIKIIIENLKKQHHAARHHCYAYILGADKTDFRIHDDGEPSGTAGKPIHGQLLSFNLTNILIVVVRYFGGTLLGTSGLINAYKQAAKDVLEKSEIIENIIENSYHLEFEYIDMNNVMKILKEEKLNQLNPIFNLKCELDLSIRLRDTERILGRLNNIGSLHLNLTTGK